MIISDKYRFIFFCNRKTASESIASALTTSCIGHDKYNKLRSGFYSPAHIPPLDVKKEVGNERFESYLKFAIVRNPYDWITSNYFYHCVGSKSILLKKNFSAQTKLRLRIEKFLMSKPLPWTRLNSKDVEHIFELHAAHNRIYDWCPSYLQSAFLCDRDGRLIVDKVCHFENLENELGIVFKELSLPELKLPHKNSSSRRKRDYLSEGARRRIRELYSDDFATFNYSA